MKTDDRLDQLAVIFGIIGTPPPSELKNYGRASEYIKSLGKLDPKPLKDIFPAGDPMALDLLGKMLAFNPTTRCTADEALNHPFFKGIRRPDMEADAEERLETPAFLEAKSVDTDVIKKRVYEEVLCYKDQGRAQLKSN